MTPLRAGRSRDRRALVAGLGIVSAMLLVVRGLPAVERFDRASEARLEEAYSALASENRLAAAVKEYRLQSSGRDSAALVGSADALQSATPAGGVATLSARVMGLADFVGAQISSTVPRGDSVFTNGSAIVGLHISLVADGKALIELLSALEAGPETIAIRSLSVMQPYAGADRASREALRVEMLIEALLRQSPNRAIDVAGGPTAP